MNWKGLVVGLILMGCGGLLVRTAANRRPAGHGTEGAPSLVNAGLNPPAPASTASAKAETGLGPFDAYGQHFVPKRCTAGSALAPEDWTIAGSESENGVSIELRSKDGASTAAYGVVGVTYLVDARGNDIYGNATPERFIETAFAQGNEISDFRLDTPQSVAGGDHLAAWSGTQDGHAVRGFVQYRSWSDDTPNSYTLAVRLGWAPESDWHLMQPVLYEIATSARSAKPHLFAESASGR